MIGPRLGETSKFLGRRYERGNGVLQIGDRVLVHPHVEVSETGDVTKTSISKRSYEAIIEVGFWKWVGGRKPANEIQTFVEGGHRACMNEYLFSRLEKI